MPGRACGSIAVEDDLEFIVIERLEVAGEFGLRSKGLLDLIGTLATFDPLHITLVENPYDDQFERSPFC